MLPSISSLASITKDRMSSASSGKAHMSVPYDDSGIATVSKLKMNATGSVASLYGKVNDSKSSW